MGPAKADRSRPTRRGDRQTSDRPQLSFGAGLAGCRQAAMVSSASSRAPK